MEGNQPELQPPGRNASRNEAGRSVYSWPIPAEADLTIDIIRPQSPTALLARAGAFLYRDEARHNVLLGILSTLDVAPAYVREAPYFAVLVEESEVAGVAIRTPPHPLALSLIEDPRAIDKLAAELYELTPDLPAVFGPEPASGDFARAWSHHTGQSPELGVSEICYRLDKRPAVAAISGEPRQLRESDVPLLTKWLLAFAAEAVPDVPTTREDEEHSLRLRLAAPDHERGMFIWEDGEPVCMVGYGNSTANSLRIGPVYTPPEQRGKGYARACTAAVSNYIFNTGRSFVTLYADAGNPISNWVYQSLGFVAVGEASRYRFLA